jgi:hypothetical protein
MQTTHTPRARHLLAAAITICLLAHQGLITASAALGRWWACCLLGTAPAPRPLAKISPAPPARQACPPQQHQLHLLLAELGMAELRAACAAAGCRPGRSRAAACASLLACC